MKKSGILFSVFMAIAFISTLLSSCNKQPEGIERSTPSIDFSTPSSVTSDNGLYHLLSVDREYIINTTSSFWPSLTLYPEDHTFVFSLKFNFGYEGRYEMEDNRLTLFSDEENTAPMQFMLEDEDDLLCVQIGGEVPDEILEILKPNFVLRESQPDPEA